MVWWRRPLPWYAVRCIEAFRPAVKPAGSASVAPRRARVPRAPVFRIGAAPVVAERAAEPQHRQRRPAPGPTRPGSAVDCRACAGAASNTPEGPNSSAGTGRREMRARERPACGSGHCGEPAEESGAGRAQFMPLAAGELHACNAPEAQADVGPGPHRRSCCRLWRLQERPPTMLRSQRAPGSIFRSACVRPQSGDAGPTGEPAPSLNNSMTMRILCAN